VYDYFRAVLKSGEKSERVLELTEDGLDLNPANYTVWYYRYIGIETSARDEPTDLYGNQFFPIRLNFLQISHPDPHLGWIQVWEICDTRALTWYTS
jgi:hypothetical protein